ncbi:MAG TPA: helicase-related protein [Rhodanobacteraceae bacterium]|nr:helicase-related protein [Rhodanobacteraceae bacterium]
MNEIASRFAPGSLVRVRGRDWIVQPGSVAPQLRLRPLSGSKEDSTLIHVDLEPGIKSAHFPAPKPSQEGSQDEAALLSDALRMALRRGAGPFRCFGNIAVEPRTYQLVPLLMALRLDPVRLLLADDVGIGKTIEAGLIARELMDRGEIERMTVLCPPHLVEQWVNELEQRFHLKAAAVTAVSVKRLERGLPIGESLFKVHPITVVSLDYIKSDRHRNDFIRACPELVIVDEAHTCIGKGHARHQRYALLKDLAGDVERHLLLLTATPHSGDQEAFYNLLALLKPEFAELATDASQEKKALREALALHFVQRRRADIDEWHDGGIFPRRETAEDTYKLSGEWEQFFQNVLDYCAEVTAAGGDERRQRLNFWGTLALMRCVSSSPAAAVQALRTRLASEQGAEPESMIEQLFDGSEDDLTEDDVAPAADIGSPEIRELLQHAEGLSGQSDPKLALLTKHLKTLLKDGFNPVIFCRYIATAHYLKDQLTGSFKKSIQIDAVTGEYPPEERERRVEAMSEAEQRILIATDCLSEGINLQDHFDAAIHYDLSWNPTRHEQREGRVDRFGQPAKVVRTLLLYGSDNPVDGAVLQVILRKAESIRKELGVPVPLPDDEHNLTQALMKAVMLRQSRSTQGELFDVGQLEESQALDITWTDMAERAKKNKTIFAQRSLHPEDVIPEWERMQHVLGNHDDVQRFVSRAMERLGATLHPRHRGGANAPLRALPDALRERLLAEQMESELALDFVQPTAPGCTFIHRSHPLVTTLADELLERALSDEASDTHQLARLGRTGVWRSASVDTVTTIALLRLRHQLTLDRRGTNHVLLVEEALPVAWQGRNQPTELTGEKLLAWLAAPAIGNLPDSVREREKVQALQMIDTRQDDLQALAETQAQRLLADHRRVRDAANARGSYAVKALQPVDVIATYMLLPGATA